MQHNADSASQSELELLASFCHGRTDFQLLDAESRGEILVRLLELDERLASVQSRLMDTLSSYVGTVDVSALPHRLLLLNACQDKEVYDRLWRHAVERDLVDPSEIEVHLQREETGIAARKNRLGSIGSLNARKAELSHEKDRYGRQLKEGQQALSGLEATMARYQEFMREQKVDQAELLALLRAPWWKQILPKVLRVNHEFELLVTETSRLNPECYTLEELPVEMKSLVNQLSELSGLVLETSKKMSFVEDAVHEYQLLKARQDMFECGAVKIEYFVDTMLRTIESGAVTLESLPSVLSDECVLRLKALRKEKASLLRELLAGISQIIETTRGTCEALERTLTGDQGVLFTLKELTALESSANRLIYSSEEILKG
ncbi:hypothetical protein [Neptuniibacter sp. QD37_11]|uniref:hypothetical protein n=1 Tax=Neptuniibacter sp. QD37_11 TaxID=3398209 RepID=UPI0039F54BF0